MLVQLSIENLALLEAVTLELAPGFNVITGETGAGKSMLVDALGLVLGGRASAEMVRRGAAAAEVEGRFVTAGESVVLRRAVQRGGRSRALVDGRPTTTADLSARAVSLCEISSQHESLALADPGAHLAYLDRYAGTVRARTALSARVASLAELSRRREDAARDAHVHADRCELLALQLREIDDLDPRLGEEDELARRRGVLRHAARLRALTRGAVTALADASGGGSSVLDALLRALADVRAAAALDPSLGAAAGTLEAVCGEVSLVARELDRHAEAIEEDPSLLDEIEHRLFRLSKLLAKHGPTTAELLAHRARVAADLAAIERAPAVIAGLDHELDLARAEATEAALALSASRRRAARRLGDAVAAELSRLGMPGARVVVEITALPPREGGLQVAIPPGAGDHGAAHLSPDGIDRVEVLLSANRGEPPRPLRRIASGGELSRVLLALKRVFADDGGATLVLDEVDAGVGGAVASAIGEAMRDIARHRQVICVTHLPQIAALADAHFVIEKASRADRTVSRVRRLAEDAREVEIAGMMGGANAGPAARGAARDLLGKPPRVAGARLASGVRLRAV